MIQAKSESDQHSTKFRIYLYFTAVMSGALVMLIEVLGARIISPFFGVSLFVWTSLISVTLFALAAGYWYGGKWADKYHNINYLYAIICLSGIIVLLMPLFKLSLLELCIPLGLRFGALISSLLLFGPPLFLLGCVSPYIVKTATKDFHALGATVGRLYAISTLGSVMGTIITGFYLIAWLGVNDTLMLCGSILILIAVVYFVTFRRFFPVLAILILPFVISTTDPVKEIVSTNGLKISRVYSHESLYGRVEVLDNQASGVHIRELMIDGLTQGTLDMINKKSADSFVYVMRSMAYALNNNGKQALVIGLGAGHVSSWFEENGITTDIVEIDPTIVDTAKKYFDAKITGEIFIQDARYILTTAQKKYDYIVLDVFTGEFTPGHIISLEAFQYARNLLTENGVIVLNVAASIKNDTYMTASIVKTVKAVFDNVIAVPAFTLDELPDGEGNLIITAYMGNKRKPDFSKIKVADFHPKLQKKVVTYLLTLLQSDSPFSIEGKDAIILTDDYNPMDFYSLKLKESIRKKIINMTDSRMISG